MSRWARARALPLTILRPSSIYGPGAPAKSVLSIFLERARRGEALEVTAPSGATQNFVHVQDVSSCVVQALRRRSDAVLNLFSDETHSYLELARRIARAQGVRVHDLSGPQVIPRAFSNEDIRQRLGVTFRSLDNGLAELLS